MFQCEDDYASVRQTFFELIHTKVRENDPKLTELTVADWYDDFSARRFCGLMKTNTVLRTLVLECNCIRDIKDKRAVGDMLMVNTTLTTLSVERDMSFGGDGAYEICRGMEHNSTLTSLKFYGLDLTCRHLSGIVDALKKNTTLTELRIADRYRVSVKGENGFQRLLNVGAGLERLYYGLLAFDPDESARVPDAIRDNTRLQSLNLQSFGMTEGALAKFFEALCHNTTLTELKITETDTCGEECGVAIGKMLRVNTTLLHLDLSGCRIKDIGTVHIIDALCVNTTLKALKYLGNKYTAQSAYEFLEMIKENHTLEVVSTNYRIYPLKNHGRCMYVSAQRNRSLYTLLIETYDWTFEEEEGEGEQLAKRRRYR